MTLPPPHLLTEWYAVARVRDVRTRPRRLRLWDTPLCLFRTSTGIAAVVDRCPHRGAPLSTGRVHDDCITCPYHGWRFDTDGVCRRVPGLADVPTVPARVKALPTVQSHGLIFVRPHPHRGPEAPTLPAHLENPSLDSVIYPVTFTGTLQDVVENFLDGSHTHFVHAGWIRRDKDRQTISAVRSNDARSVEVRYDGEGKQNGIISRYFEAARDTSFSRFTLPAHAEIEYRDKGAVTFAMSLLLSPERYDAHRGFAVLSTKRGILPAFVKALAMYPAFWWIMRQDRRMVQAQYENRAHFRTRGEVSTALDLVAPFARDLLERGTVTEKTRALPVHTEVHF